MNAESFGKTVYRTDGSVNYPTFYFGQLAILHVGLCSKLSHGVALVLSDFPQLAAKGYAVILVVLVIHDHNFT